MPDVIPLFNEASPKASGKAKEHLLFPCSSTQKRFWFFDQLNPGISTLNINVNWNLRGQFSMEHIKKAFLAIIERHEILRTRYVEHDGIPLQEVCPMSEVNLVPVILDITHLPDEQLEEKISDLTHDGARTPIDVSDLMPLRLQIIKVRKDRVFLSFYVHHSCFDGASCRVMGHELETLLAAYADGTEPVLPELPLQFGDYALWEKDFIENGDFETERDYWTNKLRDIPYFEIEPDRERGPVQRFEGRLVTTPMPDELSTRVREAARQQGVSMFNFNTVVIAAFLHRLTGKEDIVITTQVSDRNDVSLDNLIGVFTNNLVLRFDISGDPTFSQFLATASNTLNEALIHQQMPFQDLIKMIRPPRQANRTPVSAVNFETALEANSTQNFRHGGFELSSEPFVSTGTVFDLNLMVIDWTDGWRMAAEYDPDVFDKETAENFLQLWKQMMEIAVTSPQTKLSSIPIHKRRPTRKTSDASRLEIMETILLDHPATSDVEAVVHFGADGSRLPFVYVAPSIDWLKPLEQLPGELMKYLADNIEAGQKMPAGISILPILPRGPDGVIQKNDLPLIAPQPAPVLPGLPAPAPAASIDQYQAVARQPERKPVAQPDQQDDESRMLLEAIWCEVLGIDKVHSRDNFFDLGGHSLLVVKMLSRVRKEFKQDHISVGTLFKAPTLDEFHKQISLALPKQTPSTEPKGEIDWEIIKIQPKGSLAPIFAINQSLLYYYLSRRIGEDRPFIDIQIKSDGLLDDTMPNLTFVEIAQSCLEQIRSVRPHGPYILFGHCVNGNLAYEIAQILKQEGEEVQLLGMVDCMCPGYLPTMSRHAQRKLHWSYKFSKLLYSIKLYRTSDLTFKEAFLRKIEHFRDFANSLPGDRFSLPLTREEIVDQKLSEYLIEARSRNRIKPYGGMVINFLTKEIPPTKELDRNVGWGKMLTGYFSMPRLQGWHQDIYSDPTASQVAENINKMLKLNQQQD